MYRAPPDLSFGAWGVGATQDEAGALGDGRPPRGLFKHVKVPANPQPRQSASNRPSSGGLLCRRLRETYKEALGRNARCAQHCCDEATAVIQTSKQRAHFLVCFGLAMFSAAAMRGITTLIVASSFWHIRAIFVLAAFLVTASLS